MPPIPKLDKYVAPWEKNEGDEIDPVKAKAFIHSLLVRGEKVEADLAAAVKAKEEAESALTAKDAEITRKGEDEATRVAREKKEAEDRVAAAEAKTAKAERDSLRVTVAFEKGLTPGQAKRLMGETKEELEADADEILKDFPVAPEQDEDDVVLAHRRPRTSRNPLDPDSGSGAFDVDKAIAQIPRTSAL